jgi:hypothetical protein
LFGRHRHIGLLLLQVVGGCTGRYYPQRASEKISRTPIRKPIIVIAWLDVGRDRE